MAKGQAKQRRRPRQARAQATCEAIVEAAAQILERDGAAGFNTNAIAARAGVSIGTLYQYFPDKAAVLLAAARRELGPQLALLGKRQGALVRALLELLDLGQFGAEGSRSQPVAARSAAKRRLRDRCERLAERVCEWLFAPAPEPLLQPIPIRRQEPRR